MFCKKCTKCPSCCTKSDCRGQIEPILGNLANHGGRAQSSSYVKRRVHPTLPNQTKLDQVTDGSQLLCKSPQEQLPAGGIASADKEKCNRIGHQPPFSRVLQSSLFGPQTKQQMETHLRSEQSQQISQDRKIQDGDPRNYPDLPPDRGVGYIHRLQGRLLPHTHSSSLQEISEISCRGQNISVQGTSLWPIHSTSRVYSGNQRGKTDSLKEGYKNPPVPGRLVGPGHIPPNLSPAYSDASITVSGHGLGSKFRKIRAGTQTAERDSRQAIQTGPDHSNGVVTSSRGIQSYMRPVALPSSGPVCHQVQQQTATVCLTGPRPPGLGSGCTQPVLGGPGPIRLPTGSHLGQSGGEATGLPLQQNTSDCTGVAQHALVLGPGSNVKPDPIVSAQHTQPSVSAIQPGPSQEPVESEPTCLAPRAATIKEQGFSEAVAARIEAPQRGSTRSVYEAKWTIFTKWCLSNQVDFRAPPLKAIADFLLYLFQDKKLQPGTIDGYRSAIADKLGNSTINVSKDENLTRLLDSFHRDRPKGRRGIPSWNLSLVLHQLTKAPFEPLKEASLKHLTFKTVFLLALGSGKRRSEIHAWLHKNIRHQSDWSKVSLYPSPSFLSKNQLAKEGPDSVAPVVIPALAPSLDRSLKDDRSLCPVRALRYYLDRTSDLRQNKELVFVSFKKGFDRDISPATISSWIKQTVILCYELSDQEALTLHQVKAHDVRAFAASKAFQSGISLDQILSACHWKSQNTFTHFYLKDVAWADSELFHLGPVVAAQQVHHQAQK